MKCACGGRCGVESFRLAPQCLQAAAPAAACTVQLDSQCSRYDVLYAPGFWLGCDGAAFHLHTLVATCWVSNYLTAWPLQSPILAFNAAPNRADAWILVAPRSLNAGGGPQGYPTNLLLPQQLFHLRPLAILQFYPGPGCVTPGTLSAIWMSRTAAIPKKREREINIFRSFRRAWVPICARGQW